LSSSGLNPTAKDFVAIKSPERVSGLRVSGGAFGGEFNPERFDYGRLPRPPLKIAFLATAIKNLEYLWDGKSGEETHDLAAWCR
jgi:hypothetical protein